MLFVDPYNCIGCATIPRLIAGFDLNRSGGVGRRGGRTVLEGATGVRVDHEKLSCTRRCVVRGNALHKEGIIRICTSRGERTRRI